MNDREFIELLNLYVDREISAKDALRLESEVIANPRRREIYDQYCRMQKACSLLAHDLVESSVTGTDSNIVNFPSQEGWRMAPTLLGLAAALACAVGIVTYKLHRTNADAFASSAASLASNAVVVPAAASAARQADADSMKPVFVVSRVPDATAQAPQFAAAQPTIAELNWIGNVQMPPVFTSGTQEFVMGPKTGIKAAAIADAPADSQEPAEMTAFRFQR
jgi:hypothetical protein